MSVCVVGGGGGEGGGILANTHETRRLGIVFMRIVTKFSLIVIFETCIHVRILCYRY